MSSAQRTWMAFALLALIAAAMRLPDLGRRPMHTDEAINAYTTGQLLEGEPFRYDPQDRHGPALFAFAVPVARLAGSTSLATLDERVLRRSAVLLSMLVILSLGLLARSLGPGPTLLAATFWTFAPASLYYGRYIIHETGFIAATILFLAGLLRWREGVRWPVLCGLGAGLMLAFKETAVLAWAAAALALLVTDAPGVMLRLRDGRRLTACIAAALALVALAFSWGGTHWAGIGQLVDAATRVTVRAGGEGHEKPWTYYLGLLALGKSGPLLLLAALAGAWRAWKLGTVGRWWIAYTLIITAIHSMIPYKTPWLALSLLLPLMVLAGLALSQRPAWMVAGGLALLAAFTWDAKRWVWRDPAGERNPFAYAHTSEDLLRLPEVVEAWTKKHGDPLVAVVADDPWPLPWYLRNSPRVGYWRPGQDPGKADVYITDLAPGEAIAPRIDGWIPEFFGHRTGVLLVLWTAKR